MVLENDSWTWWVDSRQDGQIDSELNYGVSWYKLQEMEFGNRNTLEAETGTRQWQLSRCSAGREERYRV